MRNRGAPVGASVVKYGIGKGIMLKHSKPPRATRWSEMVSEKAANIFFKKTALHISTIALSGCAKLAAVLLFPLSKMPSLFFVTYEVWLCHPYVHYRYSSSYIF